MNKLVDIESKQKLNEKKTYFFVTQLFHNNQINASVKQCHQKSGQYNG